MSAVLDFFFYFSFYAYHFPSLFPGRFQVGTKYLFVCEDRGDGRGGERR